MIKGSCEEHGPFCPTVRSGYYLMLRKNGNDSVKNGIR